MPHALPSATHPSREPRHLRPRVRALLPRAIGVGAVALGLALGGSARAAQPLEYPPATCTRAESPDASRAAFVRATAAYDQSSNDEAVTQFALAYRLDCTRHTFLSFLAQVLERQTRFEEAVGALEVYLQRAPDVPASERATIEAKVKNLREQARKKKADEAAKAAAFAAAAAEAAKNARPAEIREHTVPPWLVVGVGGAAVATGIVLIAVAPDLPKTCDEKTRQCLITASQADRDQAGLSQNLPLAGTITVIGGGALVAGGLLWHFLEPTGPVTTGSPRTLVPAFGPGYAGLAASGTF
ncbi:MAG: hypothetical protein IPF92_24985 [Myxococcales bacterium]|nr:hypothetical protein [Myxococcales bacterium]MBL0195821.1 hypothetical protein [Myxococcales bacterium]HQY60112.1 hypothetical protein [Polyangiaceae bacterium]